MAEDPISTGEKAPEFSLPDQSENLVKLEDFSGRKVLLSFHPLAWTGVCRNQMEALEEKYDKFAERDIVPLGISVDPVPSKQAWAEDMGLQNLRILSDFWPHGQMAVKYGVFIKEKGISERANIVVDEQGKVEYVKVYPIGELPDFAELLEEI